MNTYFFSTDFSIARGIIVEAPRTHLIQYNGSSIGNVVTGVDYRAQGYGTIDHHGGGGMTMRNLVENSKNLLGANASQGARFNVFWNISAAQNDNINTEFLPRGYQRLPKSIFVGVNSASLPLYVTTVGNEATETNNKWYYLENMNNRNIKIPSVYQAQLELIE
ncbi:hypothetical protein [uncultured Vibrio sp.]|uniref:hypothetical protein n=1 Tax=uncultured Vibrio sp. TaxID=114054 RepID=UPI0026057E78|nr:hypothetical protein [uncultured Vibrio sp.]